MSETDAAAVERIINYTDRCSCSACHFSTAKAIHTELEAARRDERVKVLRQLPPTDEYCAKYRHPSHKGPCCLKHKLLAEAEEGCSR